jgi:hypothetical protein
MIEVNTTYLWQTPDDVDVKGFCTSIPVTSTNIIHADMDFSTPVSAVFIPGNTLLPQISA